ncbi:hypothetical protein MNBD_GAMMA10-2757 [hydrothermal vent metagenome]|uniref:Uncharacterized protein n=1 Tax=hydrothermal vent metagenome TaxID=652676 RepID=A0A3B0XZY1_9ZZZZ
MEFKHIFFAILFWTLSALCIAVEQDAYLTKAYYISYWVDKQSVIIQSVHTDKSWYYSFKTHKLVALSVRSTNAGASSPTGQFLFATHWSYDKLSLVNLYATDFINRVQTFAMPAVVSLENSDDFKGHREQAFWISDKRIYVEYYNISSGGYQCHIFNIHSKHWESVLAEHCFNFMEYSLGTSGVRYLGNDLYAITESSGGEVTFKVVKWVYKKGNIATKLPMFWIGSGSSMQFYYEEQDLSLYVLSSAPLDPDNTPVDYARIYWGEDRILYRWAQDKYFSKTDIKLDNRVSLYSVQSKRTAWINVEGDEICMGELARKLNCYKIYLK